MATAAADAGAAPKKGKKKLLVLVLAALLVLGGIGGGVLFWMKQKAAAAQAEEDEESPAAAPAARDPKAVPAFLPLDVFTVNLADREAERYAQVGITLELVDAKEAERIKNFMPAIRNNILMLLAHKTSAELLGREGKVTLAREVRRETARALGLELDDEDDAETADAEDEPAKKKRKKRRRGPTGPVHAVHFSNFIIQ